MNHQKNPIPLLPPMTPEEIQAFYRKAKERFRPEDAKIYEESDDTVLLTDVIADLERIVEQGKI